MGICFNDFWINLIIGKTINSNYFEWFLKIMGKWLNTHDNFWYLKLWLCLIVELYIKAKFIKRYLRKFVYTIIFILVYSPDFACFEMWFSQIKRKLDEIGKEAISKISVKNNYAKIFDSLLPIKSKTVRNMFAKFFKQYNASIRFTIVWLMINKILFFICGIMSTFSFLFAFKNLV